MGEVVSQFVYYKGSLDEGEMPSTILAPCHLLQARKAGPVSFLLCGDTDEEDMLSSPFFSLITYDRQEVRELDMLLTDSNT